VVSRQTIGVVLATAACAHSPPPAQEPTRTIANERPADPGRVRPLTFAAACVPKSLRVPVRADIEPGRTPDVDHILFLRPLCIADHGETTCHDRPDVLVADKRAFHGDGIGELWISPDPTRLTVSVENFDQTMALADALALTEAAAVIEDGCVTIPWSSEGVGTLHDVRGDVTRDAGGPWMFRPSPRLCAPTHVPGDDRVFDAPLPVTGTATTAIPTTGLAGVYVIGTLRAPAGTTSSPFVQSRFSVVADSFVTLQWQRRP
jgi:hypothetical protein